jgi:virginiamycin B lyase
MPSTRYVVALVVLLCFVGLTVTASPATAKGNSGGVVVTNYPVPIPFANPSGIVTGPDGALWFTDSGIVGSIGRMTTAGVLTTFTDPSISAPQQITVGPDGALWFTNFNGGSIGRITTTGAVSSYTAPGLTHPYSITADADGALWFTYQDGIGRITTAGVITNLVVVPGINIFNGLTTTSDGSLWFLDGLNVDQMTPSGVMTNSYWIHSIPGSLEDITTGSDGALWVTSRGEKLGGFIYRVTTAGAITQYSPGRDEAPFSITSGPDGALWFIAGSTRFSGDWSVERLTTAGALTSYEGPGLNDSPRQDDPQYITAGPDRAVWFTDLNANNLGSIGRVSVPTPTITGFSPASAVVGHGVHIEGVDLSNATAVTFNGIPAIIGKDDDTKINTTVPLGATSGPVVVTTPDGVASAAFTVPLPTISTLTPSSGPIGTTVRIGGANLFNATVKFDGTLATIVNDGAKTIVTNVPPGAFSGPVTVTTPDGTAMSSFVVT